MKCYRLTYTGGSLKVQLFRIIEEEEQEIGQWTDTTAEKIEWFNIFHANSLAQYQFRNIKQADTGSSTCINNVGSFQCVDIEDEMVAVGVSGHTHNGNHKPPAVGVVMADGTTCIGHGIANYASRLYHQVGVLDEWLWACGGDSTRDCKKVR